MATFLDISILGHFTTIFTFLLVFVIIFGMLEIFKIFGEGRKGLHAIISLCIGFIVIMSKGVTTVVQTFTPWFTILILVIFFILFAVRMFSMESKDIGSAFRNNTTILTVIIILTLVILLFSLGTGFGQQALEQTQPGGGGGTGTSTQPAENATGTAGSTGSSSSYSQNLYNTLFNPKVLGFILVMLIVVFAMLFLTVSDGG